MSQAAAVTDVAASETQPRARFLQVPDPQPRVGFLRLLPRSQLAAQLLRVTVPVVLGMVTQTAINILDTIMIGQLPATVATPAQAAIGPSLVFMWMVGGFLSAIWVGTQALTSRRTGEGQLERAGQVLLNSLLLAVLSSLLVGLVALLLVPAFVNLLYDDPTTVAYGVAYLRIRVLGIPALVATFSLKSFFDGIGKTHVFMVTAVIMNGTNVVLNLLLIFGNPALSVPRLELEGAAWASVLAAYLGLAILLVWALRPLYFRRYRYLGRGKLSWSIIKEIVRLSLPNGLATVVVMVGVGAFYWVVGQVNNLYAPSGNPVIAAANQAVITAFMLTLMTALAVGSATAAVVSQAVGANRTFLGECYGWESVKLWGGAMGAYGVAMILLPEAILGLINPDPAVIATGASVMRLMGFVQAFAGAAVILGQTLYGLGNAQFVMYVELFCHLFIMPPVAYLGGLVLDWGLMGIYMAPLLYVAVLLSAMGWKFSRGDWKRVSI